MTEEEKLLLARAEDTVRLSEARSCPKFLGFLDETQAARVAEFAVARHVRFTMYGGFPDAERVFFGVCPPWAEELCQSDFPITPLTLRFRKGLMLSHRDVLGALMGLKLKRESVGDILVEDGRAVVFLQRELAEFVCQELRKVGSAGVSVTLEVDLPLPQAHQLQDCSVTISSPRLDAVVAAVAATGRSEASELIEAGLVALNAIPCTKATKAVSAGDILKIRGKGKFILTSLCDKTKKQRIVLKYKKYI